MTDRRVPSADDAPGALPAEALPRPTIAPAIVGLGVAMSFAGLVLQWVVAATGLLLLGWGIALWMKEVRRGWRLSK
ncbi:MAG TPA: hypothetical protein PKC43_04235 [Phycisphaerales bacterium]|nr:hypothetical protein [Phycisphaerales bacterium]HMP36636.1 hypothetical protein [Phycisphaerales bacterium]